LLSALDGLFLLRPLLMPPVWTIGLLGFGRGQEFAGETGALPPLVPIGLFTLLTGGVYAQNQIYDIESDRKNSKLFLLADGFISLARAQRIVWSCFALAVGGAWWHARWLGALVSVAALAGMAYNMPPFRWKDRPVEGFMYNVGVYGVIVFLTGWGGVAPITPEAFMTTLPYCLGVAAIYLNTTLPDISGDRATGKITFGVRYGFQPTSTLACALLAAGAAAALWLRDGYFALPALICLPFFIRMRRSGRVEDVALATKLGVLTLSLAAVVVYPPYMVLLALLYFGAQPYYRLRFGIRYPSFRYQR
jgi:chlorophyll synthase